MSFILEALKRAERSRRPGQQRDSLYRDVESLPKDRHQRFWPWFWVGGALVANALVLALVLRPKAEHPQPPPEPVRQAEVTRTAPSIPAVAPKPAITPPEAAARVEVPAPKTAVTAAQSRPPEPTAPVAKLTVTPAQPTKPTARPSAPPLTPAAQAAALVASEPMQAAPVLSTSSAPAPSVISARTASPQPAAAPAPVAPAAPASAGTGRPSALPPVTPITRQPAADVRASASEELSPQERQALPRLELSAHVYADDPAQRLVFINGQSYRTGQRIGGGGGPVVKEITPDGVVVDYGSGVVRLKAER